MIHPVYARVAAGTDKYVGAADTAKLARLALGAAFPGVKFYVRLSPGGSLNVRYDGISGYAPLRACYCPVPTTSSADPARCSVCGFVGRLAPIYNPGMPTLDAVRAAVAPFAGSDFDGMVDLAFPVSAWLNPDGSATLGHSSGSGAADGAGSVNSGYDFPRPMPGAVMVHFSVRFVFVDATLPYDVVKAAAA